MWQQRRLSVLCGQNMGLYVNDCLNTYKCLLMICANPTYSTLNDPITPSFVYTDHIERVRQPLQVQHQEVAVALRETMTKK